MTTPDEGVREIQLNGKQLVFLFMAVTVVSVIIFLCGVLVGRGVQRRTSLVDAPVMPAAEAGASEAGATDAPAPTGPTTAPNLSFPKTLNSPEPPAETLTRPREAPAPAPAPAKPAAGSAKPVAAPPTPAPAATPARTAAAAPPPAAPAPTPAKAAPSTPPSKVPGEPAGSGFAIQVAALRERGEAEVILRRLIAKGYSAYLMPPSGGPQTMFRVRVGKFAQRADAEKVASRLERDEQFKPWITR